MRYVDLARDSGRGQDARRARRLPIFWLVAVSGVVFATSTADAQPGVDELLARVSERVATFYKRIQNVICIERSSVQPIDLRYSSQGFGRTVESELRVEADDSEDGVTVVRDVRKVNGRAPREKDAKDRAGCTDPTPLSTEPLAFLLPAHREEYRFTSAGSGKDRDRPALRIDFASVNRKSSPELIEDKMGHDDCFDWTGHIASSGRVWVDANTYDVLRVEHWIGGPVDVRVPLPIQRRHNLDRYVVIVRQDTTVRYRKVAFRDPDEVLLLPESVEEFILVSGGLQSTRRSQVYSDYRRFVGTGRVVE